MTASSRSSNEGKYYVWFKGGSIISIVNTETFKFKDISILKGEFLKPSFFHFLGGSKPIAVTTNKNFTKIAIISVVMN